MEHAVHRPLRWLGLLVLLFGFSLPVQDAGAQRSARGSTASSDTARVAPQRPDRSARPAPRQQEEASQQARTARGGQEQSRPDRAPVQDEQRRVRTDGRGATQGVEQGAPQRRRDDPEERVRERSAEPPRAGAQGRYPARRPTEPARRPSYADQQGRAARYNPPRRIPPVRVDIEWPWEYRYRRGWAPRYQYRQVVFVETGWGRRHRASRVDVRTYYRHRVRHATPWRAEIDIFIEAIELYEDGYYLGEVRHIPADLARIRATVHRGGRVTFDRSVFLVGDSYAGFELISTRAYDRYILDAYHRSHGLRVGVVDLRRGRVRPVPYSRLFDPYNFDGYAPVSLLPDDPGWLCDYGYEAVSLYHYDDYYWDDYGYENYYYGAAADRARYSQVPPREGTLEAKGIAPGAAVQPLQRKDEQQIQTERGATVHLKREVELKRIE